MGTRQERAERDARIESGVQACLDECRAKDQPYARLNAFIEKLQDSPEWTAKDIIELQTQVIRALLYRKGCPSADSGRVSDTV